MTFDELTEFKKDVKNLLKKYRTLSDDLEVVKRVLEIKLPLFDICNVEELSLGLRPVTK